MEEQHDHLEMERSPQDVGVIRGAHVDSDYYLLRAIVMLRKAPKEANNQKLDIPRLNASAVRKACNLELKNRFSALENETNGDDYATEEKWDNIKAVYDETVEK
jgi:hypothetical protein